MRRLDLALLVLVVSAAAEGVVSAAAEGQDHYFVKPALELEVIDGELPANFSAPITAGRNRDRASAMHPYARLNGDGEAYVRVSTARAAVSQVATPTIAIRAKKGDAIGTLYWPKRDASGMIVLKFRVPASEASAGNRNEFLETKRAHYQALLNRDIAGAAWFRHQVRETSEQLGEQTREDNRNQRRLFGARRANDMDNTFALVSGGRAVSENLQLDRVLPSAAPGDATVPVDSIQGITVRPFNWKPLIKEIDPKLDPLASYIPEDQHALFFPSFQAVADMIDHASEHGTPILRLAEPRAEDAQTRQRYQRQLCLPLGQLERIIGPQLIQSVAVTGGDPYLRTGTDVAVLFESNSAGTLRQLLVARQVLARKDFPDAELKEGEMLGVKYSGIRSAQREVCSYLAIVGDAVVVTNSAVQLKSIIQVHNGASESLASLDEYRFFRHRYPLGADNETALLIISDDTIRRWCGPRWRIATSRRTRAAAVMSELQAQNLDRLVGGDAEQSKLTSKHWLPEVGRFSLSKAGVSSSVYGNLEFQTPISELDFDYALQQEATFYKRWRDGYQRNWSNFFDPIAVQFFASENKVSADMTVMPLIANSQYNQFLGISRGAKIGQGQGDPHPEALVHLALAINTESSQMQTYSGFLRAFVQTMRVDPLSWLGNVVSVYVDKDAFWAELVKAEDNDEFLEDNSHRLPIAVHIDVRSGIKLAAFLAGMRAWIDQTVPGMIVWETKQYGDRSYVKLSPSDQAKSENERVENLALYYSTSGKAWILSPNETVLKRAIDREIKANDDPDAEPAQSEPWIGDNLSLQVERDLIQSIDGMLGGSNQHVMQARAWGNLAILNEWKLRYPDHDPVALHEHLWHRRLVCPGDGSYKWNDEWRTMESTLYGHPGEPKEGPRLPLSIRDISFGNFGLTFEQNGLRARMELLREAEEEK